MKKSKARRQIQKPEIEFIEGGSTPSPFRTMSDTGMVKIEIGMKAATLWLYGPDDRGKFKTFRDRVTQSLKAAVPNRKDYGIFIDVGPRWLEIRIGHVTEVCRRLKKAGIEFRVEDRRDWPGRSAADDGVRDSSKGEFRALAQQVVANPLSQIEVASSRQTVKVMAFVIRLFPKSRITILVQNRKRVRAIRAALSAEIEERMGLHLRDTTIGPRRFTITLFHYAASDELRGTHVWVVPDAIEMLSEKAAQAFQSMLRCQQQACRWIAFKRSGDRFSVLEQLNISAQVGGVVHRMYGCRILPTVYGVDLPLNRKKQDRDLLARKRMWIWHNDDRNQLIADITRALEEMDFSRLRELGIHLRRTDQAWLRQDERRIAILTESVEQATAVQSRLPDLPVLTMTDGCNGREFGWPDHRIVTTTFAQAYLFPAHILIRADAGSGLPRIKNFPMALSPQVGRQLLIDIGDHFDKLARQTTRERRSLYVQSDWDLVGCRRPSRPAATPRPHQSPVSTTEAISTAAASQAAAVTSNPSGSTPDAAKPVSVSHRRQTGRASHAASDRGHQADPQQPSLAAHSVTKAQKSKRKSNGSRSQGSGSRLPARSGSPYGNSDMLGKRESHSLQANGLYDRSRARFYTGADPSGTKREPK